MSNSKQLFNIIVETLFRKGLLNLSTLNDGRKDELFELCEYLIVKIEIEDSNVKNAVQILSTLEIADAAKDKVNESENDDFNWDQEVEHIISMFEIDDATKEKLPMSNNTVRIRCRITVSKIFGKY